MKTKAIDEKVIRLGLIGILITGLVISTVNMIMTHGMAWNEILFYDLNDSFMDFYNSVFHSFDKNPYVAVTRIYPAACYLLYYFISCLIPIQYFQADGFLVRASREGRLVFALYVVLTTTFLICGLLKLFYGIKNQTLLIVLLILSEPFIYQFERANIILISFILLIVFVTYKDEVGWKRHIAFLALGLSAAFKLYPAIFGLLLLKEKRWKDSIICFLYGAACLLLPFTFFGGIPAIEAWVSLLKESTGIVLGLDWGIGFKVNFACVLASTWSLLGNMLTNESFVTFKSITRIIVIILFVAAVFHKSTWRTEALLCGIMIGLPDFSYVYAIIFMAIPLAEFLRQKDYHLIDVIYMVLFSMQFAVITFIRIDSFFDIPGPQKLTFCHWIEGLSVLTMCIMIVLEMICCFIMRRIKENTCTA